MNIRHLSIGMVTILFGGPALAGEFAYMSNGVSAHNIMAMQRAISNQAIVLPVRHNTTAPKIVQQHSGPDAYGEMLYYGEYGDDTGILPLIGRGGGDENANAHIGASWQHFDEDAKFDSWTKMDTRMDLVMIEFGNNRELFNNRPADIKFFGGYAGGHAKNDDMRIEHDGGFIGSFVNHNINGLNLGILANLGFMVNDVKTNPASDNFNNMWVGLNANITYDFEISDHIIMRPGVRGGYMWIYSPNYKLHNGDKIDNKNFNAFELTPAIDFITHLDPGWSIGANVAYVLNFVDGGEIRVNDSKISDLDIDNYFEYGLKIEKHIADFDISVNVGRHDGGRSGWNGGITFKYLF